nr:MAG TPA: hypothetical protein [Caudoviricetes sp.]
MFKNLMIVTGILLLCALSYCLGYTRAEVKTVIQKNEVIRNEKNCTSALLAQPDFDDDAIVELFNNWEL